ncbi:MAG: CDP-glycerol glycerophosphotransferase family protein [Eubacterium sp.]|nr:CDP-glycerol glycerophosphotransferase family protein [Eubacterium sp.]
MGSGELKEKAIAVAKNAAHAVVDRPRNRVLDVTSALKLGAMIRVHRNDRINTEYDRKIRVAYIVQMPEVWDKQKSFFEALTADGRFNICVIIVPPYNNDTGRFGDIAENFRFYRENCRNCKIINAFDKRKKAIDIRKFRFDYVFYERPYDPYLPKSLRCRTVSGFAKTCYIPYATYDLWQGEGINTECKEFFRYLYIAFNNSEFHTRTMYEAMWKPCRLPHHFMDLGYPVHYDCIEKRDLPEKSDDKSTDAAADIGAKASASDGSEEGYSIAQTVVMWTPRWSYEPKIGGSHFMEYKEEIIRIGEEFPGAKVIIRPHPLTYDHMVAIGRMTEKDVSDYQKRVAEKGVMVDDNKMIDDTFKNVDILISDISSVMWQFFFSGKPIIYCTNDIVVSKEFGEMSELTYKASSYDDIRKHLSGLLSGNDYMKAERQKYIDAYKEKYSNPTGRMIAYLIKDFSGGAVNE